MRLSEPRGPRCGKCTRAQERRYSRRPSKPLPDVCAITRPPARRFPGCSPERSKNYASSTWSTRECEMLPRDLLTHLDDAESNIAGWTRAVVTAAEEARTASAVIGNAVRAVG